MDLGQSDDLAPAGGGTAARVRVLHAASTEAPPIATEPADVRRILRPDAGGAGEVHGVLPQIGLVLNGQMKTFRRDETDLVGIEALPAVRDRPAKILLPELDEGDVARGHRSRDEVPAVFGPDAEVEIRHRDEPRGLDRPVHEKEFVEAPGVGGGLDNRPGPHLPVSRGLHSFAAVGRLVKAGLDHPLHELGGRNDLALNELHPIFEDEVAVEEGLEPFLAHVPGIAGREIPPLHEFNDLRVAYP